MTKQIFYLTDLGCAHCAAQIEEQVGRLSQVESASLVFATGQLHVTAEDPKSLLPEIERIVHALEPAVTVSLKRPGRGAQTTEQNRHGEHSHEDCGCGEHHHHEECGCGEHHHHDECGCGEHHHHDECGCGEHHHHDECGCGEHHHHTQPAHTGGSKKIYYLENLGCAHCGAQIEAQVAALPQVSSASLVFATRQLHVTGDHHGLLPQMEEIVRSIEPAASITGRKPQSTEKSTDKRPILSEKRRNQLSLITGAVLFLTGSILPLSKTASFVVLLCAYLILGARVLKTAGSNLLRGHLFDENFLMSIATLGAFIIQEYPEAVGVMLFFRIGEAFEERAVARSRQEIMTAVDMRPETVTLAETGETVPAEEAAVGDVLLVRPGDRIPLDSTVISGESRLNTAPITGEPVPVAVHPGDSVTSGCINLSGQLTVRVENTLEQSMVTKILEAVENASASKPKIDRFISRFSKVYTPIVVVLALVTAIVPSLFTGDWNYWVYTALSFLVMSCPCALVLSVPLAFFSGIGAGSRRGILFKGGLSMESLAEIKVVAMDKTGTVTKGNFALQKVIGTPDLLEICASCEQVSSHPIAESIVSAARQKGLTLTKPEQLEEIPGFGIRARLEGRTILCGSKKLMEQQGITLPQAPDSTGTTVFVAADGIYQGYLEVSDTVKPEAPDAVRQLRAMHISTAMVTGDAEAPARNVARAVGIPKVFARLLPQEKLETLQKLRREEGAVMFVGDGINDAPVLAGADVGAAMGSGADAAIEAADVVFMTSELDAIPQSIRISRWARSIAWQNVVFALAVKVIVMLLGLLGHANMWLAVFADTGVAMLCVLNSIRILYKK